MKNRQHILDTATLCSADWGFEKELAGSYGTASDGLDEHGLGEMLREAQSAEYRLGNDDWSVADWEFCGMGGPQRLVDGKLTLPVVKTDSDPEEGEVFDRRNNPVLRFA